MEHSGHKHAETNTKVEYYKLIGVFVFIVWLGVVLTNVFAHWHWMHVFDNVMAAFFLVFGSFKLVGYTIFASGYREYDIIAKRFAPWGYIYPFVELALGLLLAGQFAPFLLNILVLVLTSVNSVGVWQKLQDKKRPYCLCLGSIIRLPLSTISLYENVVMGAMAAISIVATLVGVTHG